MQLLEKASDLWHLSQPEFESGDKTPIGVTLRRTYHILGADLRPINALTAPFLSPELLAIQTSIEGQAAFQEHLQPAYDLLKQNTAYLPNQAFLRASPFHCDNWIRDSFFGTLFLDKPDFEAHALSQFDKVDQTGHLPTTRLFPGKRTWAFDDESTMLGLIWRAKLAIGGVPLSDGERPRWEHRLKWIQSHTEDGQYVSPAGTERSWFDTYNFPRADIITYNQGIYAVSTLAAARLGLGNELDVAQAIEGYQKLQHPSGRLQFTRSLPYTDVSSLTGEFLAMALFDEQLLSDSVVNNTMNSFPWTLVGVPVVATEGGGYLNPAEFKRHYHPGDYHNGAYWPLFNAMAQATAEKHGASHNRLFWQILIGNLQGSNNAEYLYTGDRYPLGSYNPTRVGTIWNTGVYKAASMVMPPEELFQISTESDLLYNDPFISEASQMPGSSL